MKKVCGTLGPTVSWLGVLSQQVCEHKHPSIAVNKAEILTSLAAQGEVLSLLQRDVAAL